MPMRKQYPHIPPKTYPLDWIATQPWKYPPALIIDYKERTIQEMRDMPHLTLSRRPCTLPKHPEKLW